MLFFFASLLVVVMSSMLLMMAIEESGKPGTIFIATIFIITAGATVYFSALFHFSGTIAMEGVLDKGVVYETLMDTAGKDGTYYAIVRTHEGDTEPKAYTLKEKPSQFFIKTKSGEYAPYTPAAASE